MLRLKVGELCPYGANCSKARDSNGFCFGIVPERKTAFKCLFFPNCLKPHIEVEPNVIPIKEGQTILHG